jgi:hypothetical protein
MHVLLPHVPICGHLHDGTPRCACPYPRWNIHQFLVEFGSNATRPKRHSSKCSSPPALPHALPQALSLMLSPQHSCSEPWILVFVGPGTPNILKTYMAAGTRRIAAPVCISCCHQSDRRATANGVSVPQRLQGSTVDSTLIDSCRYLLEHVRTADVTAAVVAHDLVTGGGLQRHPACWKFGSHYCLLLRKPAGTMHAQHAGVRAVAQVLLSALNQLCGV